MDQYSITKTVKRTVGGSASSSNNKPAIEHEIIGNTAKSNPNNNDPFGSSDPNQLDPAGNGHTDKATTKIDKDVQKSKSNDVPDIEANSVKSSNSNPFASIHFP